MDVSFIIPVFNCLPLTRACLESLEKTVPRQLRWEVLLVDDGSTDGSREWFATLPTDRYRVTLNDPPRQGYASNNNRAARLARGEVLCLLNNDTVLLPGWLEPMLHTLRAAPRAALVGNIQREPASGLIDHAGVVFNLRGNPIHFGKDTAVPPDTEPWTRWPAVTAACCLIRRDLFLEIGGLDEQFQNGFEDVDFCLRAGELGWRHYVANESIIYHHISASPGRRAHEVANLLRYRARWGQRILAWKRRRRWRRRQFLRRNSAALLGELGVTSPAADGQPTPTRQPRTSEELAQWLESRWVREREAVFEQQRQRRQDAIDSRRDGRRYLKKHRFQPWRYNLSRLCHALELAMEPVPPRPQPIQAVQRPKIDDLFTTLEQGRLEPGGLVLFDRPSL